MPLLKTVAEQLSQNQMEAGVIEEIIDKDETFALLPFMQIVGKAYVYERELTLADADFLDPNEIVNEGASTFSEVVSKLRILIGDVDVDKFLQETMSDTNDQKAVQIAMKAKGVGRKFKNTMVNGNNSTAPKEFDGFVRLVTAGQTIDAAAGVGAALNLGMLDQLADTVPNGADAFFMREGTIRAYRALLRATGGTDAAMMEIANFGVPVLSHNGMPILKNNWMLGTETHGSSVGNTCSIYAARMNEADGLHGIYGGASAGIRVEEIGTVQNKDATRTRLKWYAGLALKSTRSIARLRGITNV